MLRRILRIIVFLCNRSGFSCEADQDVPGNSTIYGLSPRANGDRFGRIAINCKGVRNGEAKRWTSMSSTVKGPPHLLSSMR